MTICKICGEVSEEPKGYIKKNCDTCTPDKEIGIPRLLETVILRAGSTVMRTTKQEVEEIKRLRSIPTGGGHWKGGRMGDDGKVHEVPLKS